MTNSTSQMDILFESADSNNDNAYEKADPQMQIDIPSTPDEIVIGEYQSKFKVNSLTPKESDQRKRIQHALR